MTGIRVVIMVQVQKIILWDLVAGLTASYAGVSGTSMPTPVVLLIVTSTTPATASSAWAFAFSGQQNNF